MVWRSSSANWWQSNTAWWESGEEIVRSQALEREKPVRQSTKRPSGAVPGYGANEMCQHYFLKILITNPMRRTWEHSSILCNARIFFWSLWSPNMRSNKHVQNIHCWMLWAREASNISIRISTAIFEKRQNHASPRLFTYLSGRGVRWAYS